MNLPDVHRQAVAATGDIVGRIAAEQLDAVTPCDDYDVRGLLNHVVSGNYWVAPLVEGKTIDEVGDAYDGDVIGDGYIAAYAKSGASAVQAFERPDAMEAPVAVSYGPVPGAVYAGHRFLDVLIHGWDLAKATGQDTTLDPELVNACFEVIKPQLDLLKASGMFGTEVKVVNDADNQTKLLALLGRRA